MEVDEFQHKICARLREELIEYNDLYFDRDTERYVIIIICAVIAVVGMVLLL
jgi:hypothetical protein